MQMGLGDWLRVLILSDMVVHLMPNTFREGLEDCTGLFMPGRWGPGVARV
jgi:hypothetical protein